MSAIPIPLFGQSWGLYLAESREWERRMKRGGAIHVEGYGVWSARVRWEAAQRRLGVHNGQLCETWIDEDFVRAQPFSQATPNIHDAIQAGTKYCAPSKYPR